MSSASVYNSLGIRLKKPQIYQEMSLLHLFCCLLSSFFVVNKTFELVVQLEIDFSKLNTTSLHCLNNRRDDKQE